MRSQNSFSERIQRSKHSLKRHRKLVTCLAAVVVFAVTYSLVLPAVTLDEQKAEETPGIETQTKVEEQVEKAPAQVQEEAKQAEPANKADQEGSEQSKSSGGDESAKNSDSDKYSSESGSAVKTEKSDSQIKDVKDSDSKDEKADKDDADKDDVKLIDEKTELKFDGDGYKIIAEVGADAKLPADTKLKVKKVNKEAVDENGVEYAYDAYCDEALKAVRNVDGKEAKDETREVMLYDISFDSADVDKAKAKNDKDSEKSILDKVALDKDGNLEPSANVKIKIVFDEALDTSDKGSARAVHFDKRLENMNDEEIANVKKDVLETKTEGDKKDEMKEASFKSDKFSMYGFVYTAELKKEVLTASGDTYEITVTYGEDAEIPEGAELQVREIQKDEEEYEKNVELTNKKLKKDKEPEVKDPAQFDISIVYEGAEIEPKEGSEVNVKIDLAPKAFGIESFEKAEERKGKKGKKGNDEESGVICINGEEIEPAENKDATEYAVGTVAHITNDGSIELIDDVESTVEGDTLSLQFETESFSDYLFDGNSGNGLYNLPNTIYVGDEIYMWHQAHMWVSNIGSVVTETKHNNSDDFKTVTAINTGRFRIYNRYNQNEYKEIEVLPARTGTTPPATIQTVNNASVGIKMDLFDYDLDGSLDSYFNNYNHGDNPVQAVFLNENNSINNGHNLKFWGSGIGNNHGYYNQYQEHGVTSIVTNTLDTGKAGGYPVLRDDNTSLSYLFTPSDGTDKKAYTNVDGLFKKEGDYYVYDSDQNYAWFNPSTNRFDVYNSTYNQKSGGESGSVQNKVIGFFPFHKWDKDYDLYVNWNKSLNHHFGLSMSVDFSLPKDPKAVKDSNGNPIVFNFSGDDDMWVFIDGKLAMDIGGIHQPTSGSINFADKTVTVNGSRQYGYDFSNLYDGEKHTLQVFYLERGGCDSNCKIQFNLTQYGDVECDKVDNDDNTTLLPGAVFGLYKDQGCTQPLTETLKDNSIHSFVAESDENGHVKFEDVPLGTHYMKEISSPEGYPIDNTVHPVVVYLSEEGIVKVKVTIDGQAVDEGVKITNKKPEPINLGLKKVWQNMSGNEIQVSSETKAKFELKRTRTHEEYTDTPVQEEPNVSKLVVGWIHNGQTHTYKEYSFVSGTTATISWGYVNGYDKDKACVVNGETVDKSYVSGNIISHAVTMPAANQTATFYIVDNSDSGEAITNINVAGREYIGNSGGGFIREYTTISELDTGFSYTGDTNVVNNQIELPINNSWEYHFNNLPVFGKEGNITYTYSYYLEEVSTENPSETTVIYKDSNGNVVSTPSDAEISASGTQTVINKIPTGYLQINKSVTYNGEAPSTDQQKASLAGEYVFKVYTDENCEKPYKVKDGETLKDLTLKVTINNDGTAQSSDKVAVPAGDYWIEEQTPAQVGVTPEENKVHIVVTKDNTVSKPVLANFINNRDDSDNPDEMAIELEKTFTGLPNSGMIPSGFQVTLQYSVPKDGGGYETVDIPLTGTTAGNVTCTKTNNDMTWHWHVTRIPANATNFRIKESNYDVDGYTRTTTINSGSAVSNPGEFQEVTVLAPVVEMTHATSAYTTTDNNKVFSVTGDQILLVRMTNNTTVVVSQKSLGKGTRDAIETLMADNGYKVPGDDTPNAQWKPNFVYFSHEIQGDSFSYGGRTIFFDGDLVKVPHKSSSHEVRVDIEFKTETADNSIVINNDYEELPIEIDIFKEDENDSSKKLSGAVFTLRKLADEAPLEDGTINGTTVGDSAPTEKNTGKTSFGNLTSGYYEITEKTAPAGYILTSDTAFYFKVEHGTVKWLNKGTGIPSTWTEKTIGSMVSFTAAQGNGNAAFTVKNEPGAALPNAGGPGTTWMYILGMLMVVGAGMTLAVRRRMRAY